MRNTEQNIWFGKYRILSPLGEGASSQVFLAEHLKLKTHRAIKRILKSHPLQSQFRLEADLLKNLSHPAIPIVYDTEEDDCYFYIIEEYAQGETLQDYLLYHDSISPEYIMQLGIRLCDVFIYLHERLPVPVIYRDLKPEHIIVYGNSVKIVDFGIASYITSQGKNFRRYGTIGYAAPEQYLEDMVSPSTDLYALGQILKKMSERLPEHNGHFLHIIRKSTEEEPGKRYPSARELKQALEKEFERSVQLSKEAHLSYQIAVVGAKRGTGSTHIAVSLTSYLNKTGRCAVYVSESETDIVRLLLREKYVQQNINAVFENGYFRGVLRNSSAQKNEIEEMKEESGIRVLDFGVNLDECATEGADCTILVIGGSLWETEHALAAFQKLKHMQNLILICNYNHKQICKKYASVFERRIYCFPFDKDPFVVTEKKRRFFENIRNGRR